MKLIGEFALILRNLSDALAAALRPQFHHEALALNTACNGSVKTPNTNFPSSIQEVFDGIFYAAVPKSRRSREKRATRRYGCHAVKKYMTPRDNITVCLNCGNYHLIHTLCGHCFGKVREATEEFHKKNPDVSSKYIPK